MKMKNVFYSTLISLCLIGCNNSNSSILSTTSTKKNVIPQKVIDYVQDNVDFVSTGLFYPKSFELLEDPFYVNLYSTVDGIKIENNYEVCIIKSHSRTIGGDYAVSTTVFKNYKCVGDFEDIDNEYSFLDEEEIEILNYVKEIYEHYKKYSYADNVTFPCTRDYCEICPLIISTYSIPIDLLDIEPTGIE